MLPPLDTFFRLPLEQQVDLLGSVDVTDDEVEAVLFDAMQRQRNGTLSTAFELHHAAIDNLNLSLRRTVESVVRLGEWWATCFIISYMELVEKIAAHPALALEELLGLDLEPLLKTVNETFHSTNKSRHLMNWFYRPESRDELEVFHGVLVAMSPWMAKPAKALEAARIYAGTFLDPTTGELRDRQFEFPPWHMLVLINDVLVDEDRIKAEGKSTHATLAAANYDLLYAIQGPVGTPMLVNAPRLMELVAERSAYQTPAEWPPLPPPLPTTEPEPPPKKRRTSRGRR